MSVGKNEWNKEYGHVQNMFTMSCTHTGLKTQTSNSL